jgi:hypothetical protein
LPIEFFHAFEAALADLDKSWSFSFEHQQIRTLTSSIQANGMGTIFGAKDQKNTPPWRVAST